MRGPAPSLECPRCGRESPPSAELGPFTTCRGCGLSFDAAPRERQVPLRRRPTMEDPEPVPKPRQRGALTIWQALAITVLVYGAAVLLSRDDPNLAALDRIDREW